MSRVKPEENWKEGMEWYWRPSVSLVVEGILRAYSKDVRSIELKGKTRAGESGNDNG